MFTPYFTSKQLNYIPVLSKLKFKSTLIFEKQARYDRGKKPEAVGCEIQQ
jgi:hypothetical protein